MHYFSLLFFLLLAQLAEGQATYPQHKTLQGRDGRFTVQRMNERIYRITYLPLGYTRGEQLSDAVVMKPRITGSQPVEAALRGDTLFLEGQPLVTGLVQDAGHRGFYFPLRADERIWGSGERALPLNRKGYRLNLFNNPWYGYAEGADNLNYSVPFLTSSAGYGLFFDNPSNGYLDIGKSSTNRLEWGASSGELTVYYIKGNPAEVLEAYHGLTGRQPLPPRWALGNLMSRFGYTSQQQAVTIYEKMKAEDMPVEAVIFDLFWFGDSIKGTMGNLDWVNRQRWPAPQQMIQAFKKEGVQTILVTEPFLVETSRNYRASLPYLAVDSSGKPYRLTDFYFGKGGLIDIFRQDAQQWFWKFYKKEMDKGVEAWWGDLGEPEKHPADLYHNLRDLGFRRLFAAGEVHNIYGHNWTRMLFNQYAATYPNKRLFSLNRSGFAGSQRFSIFPWTGDVSRSWSGYRAQLPVLLGMTMSGVPYVHSDAGGFAGGEGDSELYVRWLQFASYTPIFRPHGTALYEIDTAAYSFPSEAALFPEPYRTAAAAAIRTRYRLLPYNYSLAYQQATAGKPLMAPLYYHFPQDTTAARIEDQYLWGEGIMVAPVLQKGAVTRSYYLPQGAWYHPGRDTVLDGGQWHLDSVSLQTFPVLYREGSFIVKNGASLTRNTSHYRGDSLEVLYVPSAAPSSTRLYEDDGSGKHNLSQGRYELITFRTEGMGANSLTLEVRSGRERYPGRPVRRKLRFAFGRHFPELQQVLLNGKPLTERGANRYSIAYPDLTVEVEFTGAPLQLTLNWK